MVKLPEAHWGNEHFIAFPSICNQRSLTNEMKQGVIQKFSLFSDKDSCSGDAGGPLFATESEVSYQIGLVSFGTNLCGRGIPGVYTRVAAYLPWIESKMEL